MNFRIQALLSASAAAVLVTTLATSAKADEVVLVGHVAPLTGGIAHLGKELSLNLVYAS